MKSKLKNKAFTLVELLLVVTILGILAAMAIPKLFPQSEKARVAEAINILSAIRQGEEAYFLGNGKYLECHHRDRGCFEILGMDDPNLNGGVGGYFYQYRINFISSDATFVASTRRRFGVRDPDRTYAGKTITIDQAGMWSGSHPLRPRNPDES